MAHRTPSPPRAAGVLLQALLGLGTLAALVVGVPHLLLTWGHQPTDLTGGINLLQQDDGTLFLTVFTCAGWTGWAAFTFSVLVEIVALLRRRSAPRIKGLRGLQSLAAFLIGGIVLLAPTAASAATLGPAVAATVHTPGNSGTNAAPSTAAADPLVDWPEHTVASATELPWDLAEEYLGDGKRWKDIAALNPDIPQLAAGDQYLPKGAVIKLPADARPIAPATGPAAAASSSPTTEVLEQQASGQDADGRHQGQDEDEGPGGDAAASEDRAERPTSVTVREGDSLWTIADAHGDPEDWPAIYAANKGEPTPDGDRFDNPHLIHPGQELDLPQADKQQPAEDEDADSPAAPQNPAGEQNQKPAADATTPQKETEQDAGSTQPTTPSATPTPSRTPPPAPSTATPLPRDGSTRAQDPGARADNDSALAPAAVWAGTGALAAALVAALATRRILQQRRRRPGRRIPMPAGRAAATEQALRAAQHPSGFDLLDSALRTLALNLAAVGRELPVIEAVVLHDAKVELHLDKDTPPMTPFAQAAGRQDLWVCPASSPHLTDDGNLQDTDAPYPALVSIGWDGSGHLVLVDLEHIGILNLAGHDFARHVLQAIAVELASTPLPDHLEITALADTTPRLEAAAPERVVRIDDLTTATTELAGHTNDQRRALAAIGADSLRAARLTDDAAGAWTPHILLAQALPDDSDRSALFDSLTNEPRTAGAVITTSAPAELPAAAWTLDCQGPDHTIALPGSHLTVTLQGLSDEHFADAIDLLTLAASDTDVPAPAWNHAEDDQQDEHEQDGPGHSAGEHATVTDPGTSEPVTDEEWLPAEYAEHEDDASDFDDPLFDTGRGEEAAGPAASSTDQAQDGPQAAPAGPSLAEVLAADAEGNTGTVPKAPATKDRDPGPTAGPGDASLALRNPPVAPPQDATIPAPTPAPVTDDAPPAEEAPRAGEGPSVLLLGPTLIEGATGRIDSNRRSAGIELVTFLALTPGVDHHGIDDALWPGRLVNKQMRNAVISRTRSWLGTNADGKAHLPRVQDTGDSRYRLGPAVTCDWTRFQHLARTGLARHDEDGDLALRRALALVRGRPFTGIDAQRYAWAEPFIQEMVSAIVDVAYELSSRRREADDTPGALWAAKRGLLAAEESELLHRQIFLAHHAAGDIDALREAATRLARINEQLLGCVDMEAETAELLRNLLPRPTTRPHSRFRGFASPSA